MTTMTQTVLNLLKTSPMTAKQLASRVGITGNLDPIHNALTNLKNRKAILAVGKAVEPQINNQARMVDIYSFNPDCGKLKFKEPTKKRYYKVDLSKAKTPQRYKELLLRKNNLFMLYAKELKLTKDML